MIMHGKIVISDKNDTKLNEKVSIITELQIEITNKKDVYEFEEFFIT